jgi:hypothetical protein
VAVLGLDAESALLGFHNRGSARVKSKSFDFSIFDGERTGWVEIDDSDGMDLKS